MGEKDSDASERTRRRRFAVESVLLLAFITAIVMGLSSFGLVRNLERQIDDIAVAYFTEDAAEAHPRVAVVAIDDATIIAHPPRSPINRALLAELLAVIDRGGAAAIGLDIFLLEAQDAESDRRLAETIKAMRTPIVLATVMRGGRVRPLAPLFAEAGATIALANLPLDRGDRTLRHYRTAFGDGDGRLHPTMPAALARVAGARVEASARDQAIDWYGRPGWQDRVDADTGGPAGPSPIPRFPALTFLSAPQAAVLLRNKVVLIGAVFEGSGDFQRTAFARLGLAEEAFAGVFAQAQVVAQLLDGRARFLPGPEFTLAAVLTAAMAGALLALMRVPVYVPIILAVLVPLAWVAVVFLVRHQTDVMLPALPPALGLGFALGGFALFRARRFERAQRIAARALNSYLPPALARRVMNDPGMLRLGGEPRTLSILFTDIAGFTAYAERHEPDHVVTVLNAYLNGMAEIVLAHQGTLDKFIGDAVMAFFGAPGELPDHAARAIACALEMDRFGRRFAADRGLRTRVGVHTGRVIVGNTGGENRFDYTVMGDSVNIASRLEGANRYLGLTPETATSVCISEDTVRYSREAGAEGGNHADARSLRRVGLIRVKGRDRPLGVYTTVPDSFASEDLEAYNRSLDELERGEYEAARAGFEALAGDDLSAFQAQRCLDRAGRLLTLEGK